MAAAVAAAITDRTGSAEAAPVVTETAEGSAAGTVASPPVLLFSGAAAADFVGIIPEPAHALRGSYAPQQLLLAHLKAGGLATDCPDGVDTNGACERSHRRHRCY